MKSVCGYVGSIINEIKGFSSDQIRDFVRNEAELLTDDCKQFVLDHFEEIIKEALYEIDYTGFWYAVQADGTSFEDSWDNGTYSLEASIALATEIAAEEGIDPSRIRIVTVDEFGHDKVAIDEVTLEELEAK